MTGKFPYFIVFIWNPAWLSSVFDLSFFDDSGEEPVNIEANDLYALPYKSIKPLVESGQIDLVWQYRKHYPLCFMLIGNCCYAQIKTYIIQA